MAKSGATRLALLGVIDENTVRKLAESKVEHWPSIIALSMSKEEFEKRISNSLMENSNKDN